MNQTGDAAEQVVNVATSVALKSAEVAGNMTGKGLLSLAAFLIATIRSEKRTKGRTRIKTFHGKPTKVFIIRQKDLPEFARQAREYGVLYAAVINRKDHSPNALIDVVVNANDAAKVNRIAERFALSALEVEQARSEQAQQHEESGSEKQHSHPSEDKRFTIDEDTLSDILGDSTPAYTSMQKEPDENPTKAGTERNVSPSAPSLGHNSRTESDFEPERTSVRATINKIKEERKEMGRSQHPQQKAPQRIQQPIPLAAKRSTKGKGNR